MSHFKLKINLKKIDKSLLFNAESGAIYLDLDMAELQSPFEDGSTHTLYQYKKADKSKVYIGQAKPWEFNQNSNGGKKKAAPAKAGGSDDLPF